MRRYLKHAGQYLSSSRAGDHCNKWYGVFFKACDWEILHEPGGKQRYMERTGVVIQERGVFLSDSSLLGESPDGAVSGGRITEVKCLWSARTRTILQAAESRDFFLELDEVTVSLTLKQTHNYWHQI